MWDNIGGKIKILAKIIAWVGIISSVIGFIIFISFALSDDHYMIGTYLGIGFCILVIGSIISWISSWFMYGFGELIEKATEIECNTRIGLTGNTTSEKIIDKLENKYEDGKHLIIAKVVNIYSEPDYKSKCMGQLMKDDIVEIIDRDHINNKIWYKIKNNAIEGWCQEETLK